MPKNVMFPLLLVCALPMVTQGSEPSQSDLRGALVGEWVGVLEYRDYSEPVASTKRVDLPTWLSITGDGPLLWHYVYDDGPGKVVDEVDVVTFDTDQAKYHSVDNGKPGAVLSVMGYAGLKAGRGVLVMTGPGTENGKPTEMRQTLTIRRNLLEALEETRPAGSQEAFSFRHVYRFVRAAAPALTSK